MWRCAKDPQFHFDTLSDVYLFGLGLDSGISDDKEEGDHTMNLFSDVAMAYVNAVRGLKHLVTDNDLVSEALGGAIKDLWSKYAREVFRRIPTKADPSEDRKD